MSGRMFQMHHAESGIPVPNARVQGTGKRAYGSIEPRSQSTHTRTVISSSTKRTHTLVVHADVEGAVFEIACRAQS